MLMSLLKSLILLKDVKNIISKISRVKVMIVTATAPKDNETI